MQMWVQTSPQKSSSSYCEQMSLVYWQSDVKRKQNAGLILKTNLPKLAGEAPRCFQPTPYTLQQNIKTPNVQIGPCDGLATRSLLYFFVP